MFVSVARANISHWRDSVNATNERWSFRAKGRYSFKGSENMANGGTHGEKPKDSKKGGTSDKKK